MNGRHILGLAVPALVIAAGLPGMTPAQADSFQAPLVNRAIYAATGGSYVYRSADGISNWQEVDNGLPTDQDILALAVTPDGGTLYAGTGSGSDVDTGSGIYISMDGGMNWSDDNGDNTDLEDAPVRAIVLNPKDSQEVYAVSLVGTFYTSNDAGTDWQATTLPFNQSGTVATSLAVSAQNPSLMLIGTAGSGVLRSSDGGATWNSSDFPTDVDVNALALSPTNARVAFAAASDGIYQSIDGGKSWQPDQRGIPSGLQFQPIAIDPSDPARIIAGAVNGNLYRSQDGGTTWSYQGHAPSKVVGGTVAIITLLFDPAQAGTVLAGTGDGATIYRSDDSGGHWSGYPTGLDNANGIFDLTATNHKSLPTDPVAAPAAGAQGVRYFPQTHHTVSGPFLTFYNADNGLKLFGLPLTEAFSDGGQTVQYFERSRLVYSQGRVSLTPLGEQLTAGRYFKPITCCSSGGGQYFPQTRHSLSGMFLTFWQSHKGAQLLGYPISQPFKEQNGDGTGRTYLVQYFQNARLEYHPELAGTGNQITLGLLGKEALQQRGWL